MKTLKFIKSNIVFALILLLGINCFANDLDKIIFPSGEFLNEHTVRIPIKLVDHLIMVEAEIQNKKGNFIFDTGSETLILNSVHFPVKYNHLKKKNASSGVLNSLDNPMEKRLKEFNLKHFSLRNKSSDVINLSHIEESKKIKLLGIIGFNILKDYEIFIDLYLNQITLTKVDKKGNKLYNKVYAEKIADSVNFTLKKHTIVINTNVNNQNLHFGLDTAAEYNQLNKNLNKQVYKLFIPKKRLLLQGASSKKIEVMAGTLIKLKLSETVFVGPMKTMLTNLTKMNNAFGTRLDGILGYEFLKRKRTIINYKKEKLYFVNNPKFRM